MTDAQILQILGLAYLAVGLGVLINPKFYNELFDQFLENLPVAYISGFAVFGIGYLILISRGVWPSGWSLIIVVIGWVALIKGLVVLISPKTYVAIAKAMRRKIQHLIIQGVLVTVVGLVLMYLGFYVL